MSTSRFCPAAQITVCQAVPSAHDFAPVFWAAEAKFYKRTGKSLHTHPFNVLLGSLGRPGTLHNLEAVLDIFQKQTNAFSKFNNTDERLMEWLGPIICVLHSLSKTLPERIGLVSNLHHFHMTHDSSLTSSSQTFSPAKKILVGIGILLSVCFFTQFLITALHDIELLLGFDRCCDQL